jgi:hypothetical protein
MRSRVGFKASLLLVGTLLLTGLSACVPAEDVENAFESYGQTVDAGMIERGWIPAWLPEKAINIREKHNLDTNAGLLFFTTEDQFTVPEGCHADDQVPSATLTAEWWPEAIVMEMPAYTCDDGFMAVDEPSSNVYFWCP